MGKYEYWYSKETPKQSRRIIKEPTKINSDTKYSVKIKLDFSPVWVMIIIFILLVIFL